MPDDTTETFEFEPIAPRPSAPTAPEIDINPYRSPAGQVTESVVASSPDLKPRRISFSGAFSTTWRIFKPNLAMCVAGFLLSSVCFSLAFSAGRVFLIILGFAMIVSGGTPGFYIAAFLAIVYNVALMSFFMLGMMKFMLTVARGGPGDFGALFSAWPMLLSGVAIFLILAAGVTVGGLIPVLPFLLFEPFVDSTPIALFVLATSYIVSITLFAIFFGWAPIVFLDKRTGAIESFKLSVQAMKPNLLPVFLILLATWGLTVLDLLSCGVAALVTFPFRVLLYAVVYLMATGQPTGLPSSNRSVPE